MDEKNFEEYLEGTDGVIFTEGKTDWWLLKKAKDELHIEEKVNFFDESKTIGDVELLNLCESYSKMKQLKPYIFIFDKDNKEIVKKVSERNRLYKEWGNNVFSFVLPIPNFRNGYESFSIEFLFRDEDLKLLDENNRRLFISTEFDERSGNHNNDSTIHVGNAKQLSGYVVPIKPKIIDANIGVFNAENSNIAQSKSDFANNVLRSIPPFDKVRFDGFKPLFSIIQEIVKRSKPINIPIRFGNGFKKQTNEGINKSNSYIDHPPFVQIFVGRTSYVKQIDDPKLRVAAITGLGGEGKSTLATKFFNLAREGKSKTKFNKFGWCDCKELESSFHERLLVLIEELTGGVETKQRYTDENINDTVKRLIRFLNTHETLVIFDNIDGLVDKDSYGLVSTAKLLFDTATSSLGKSFIVFTCRPAIHDYHQTFLEIPLVGLSFIECQDLTISLNINIPDDKLRLIHEKTKGHVLWLNLIFGQIRSGRILIDNIEEMLNVQSKFYNDLNTVLLRSIWQTLNPKEKEIIYAISIFTRPPDLNKIERVSGIAYQKCKKIVETLISMRLVLEIDHRKNTLFDLHPIIRTKAKEECKENKLQNLVSKVVAILVPGGWGQLAVIMKGKDYARVSLENYVECCEVALEHHDYKTAMYSLKELSKFMWMIGEDAKFLELCKRLFDSVDSVKYKIGSNETLEDIFEKFHETLLHQEEYETAERYLSEFHDNMQTIKEFMLYSRLKGYHLWYINKHNEAVVLMRDSIKEIKQKKEEVSSTLVYNLGLALRDSDHIDEAIEIFAKGRSQDVLDSLEPNNDVDASSDIGNLGRCFFLKGDYKKALLYVRKSADYLNQDESRLGRINVGYAYLWLSDIYIKLKEFDLAHENLQSAVDIWTEYAPARLKKIKSHIEDYPKQFKIKYSFEIN